MYPFDEHDTPFELSVYEAGRPVPTALVFKASLHDWHVTSSLRLESRDGSVLLDMQAHRSVSVVAFAIGLMCVLFMSRGGDRRDDRPRGVVAEVRLPDVGDAGRGAVRRARTRNSMPNTPPVGTLSEFIVFFWALLITTVCMVVTSIAWLRNADREID